VANSTGNRDDKTAPARTGFQAQIKGATLSDLIQLECLAGSRSVVRIASGPNVGHVYFRGGSVVHAAARSLTGEAAVLEILKWREGTFEPVDREWPAKDTISCTWQSLLLRAAQLDDERRGPNILSSRADGRPLARNGSEVLVESMELEATPLEVGGHVLRSEDFQLVVRLSAAGGLTENSGGSPEFAEVVAYASRLAELIGEQMGMERFVAMECTYKDGPCFVVREGNGEVVALRPRPSTDCRSLRELLGI